MLRASARAMAGAPGPVRNAAGVTVQAALARVFARGGVAKAVRERWQGAAPAAAAARVDPDALVEQWRRNVGQLLPLGGTSTGNQTTLYFDGDAAFDAMWEAIDGAQHSVQVETYILANDAVGLTTLEKLADAAERGVEVTLIFDHWGARSISFRDMFNSANLPTRRLRRAGARVVCFNPWLEFFNPLYVAYSWLKTRSVFHRTHRKLLIVDGQVGFCGGRNVGADYAGLRVLARLRQRRLKRLEEVPAAKRPFRDTHMRVTGPAVQDMLAVFRDSLHEAETSQERVVRKVWRWVGGAADQVGSAMTRRVLRLAKGEERQRRWEESWLLRRWTPWEAPEVPPVGGPLPAALYADGVRVGAAGAEAGPGTMCQVGYSNRYKGIRSSQQLIMALRNAQHYVLITAAYFLPTYELKRAILDACRRGVQVHMVTAGPSDSIWVKWGSRHVSAEYLRAGLRVYEYQPQVLHAKSLTCDGVYSVIGTSNMERWSLNRNLETDVAMVDAGVARELELQFNRDLAHCRPLTLAELDCRSLPVRAWHYLAYLACVVFPSRHYGNSDR